MIYVLSLYFFISFTLDHFGSTISACFNSWRAPKYIRERPENKRNKIRKKNCILAEGDDMPPICETFQECKFPKALIHALKKKGITKPSPIQMQGLPTV